MAVRSSGTAIREIRTLLDWGAIGSWTDRQLLAHLSGGGKESEAALRVLIQRHAQTLAIQVFDRYPEVERTAEIAMLGCEVTDGGLVCLVDDGRIVIE
jgi:hypothetical protein